MSHSPLPPAEDAAALRAQLEFVKKQYRSLQISMKYQRESFLNAAENHFLLKLAPRRYRSIKTLKAIDTSSLGWCRILWRKPLKFGLWWTARKLKSCHTKPVGKNNLVGEDMHRHLSSLLEGKKFSHVFFMTFFSRAGGEKYLLNIIDELSRQNPLGNILMLSYADYTGPTWEEKLPIGVSYIDLSIFCHAMPLEQRHQQAFQLAGTVSQTNAYWHFQVSEVLEYFLKKHKDYLKSKSVVFYYFCNYLRYKGTKAIKNDNINQQIEENFDVISKLVSDNSRVIDDSRHFLKERNIDPENKLICLHTKLDIINDTSTMSHALVRPTPRIFWASRLDKQKRPSLIHAIGEKMQQILPDQMIDVYGYHVMDQDVQPVKFPPSVRFHGHFNGLPSLDIKPGDILLYTSHIDGLPNLILEAVSLGATVIAPDVGGISDIIKNDETGLLLPNIPDDQTMADLYVDGLVKLLRNVKLRLKLAQKAQKLLQKNHDSVVFAENVRKIFEPAGE